LDTDVIIKYIIIKFVKQSYLKLIKLKPLA